MERILSLRVKRKCGDINVVIMLITKNYLIFKSNNPLLIVRVREGEAADIILKSARCTLFSGKEPQRAYRGSQTRGCCALIRESPRQGCVQGLRCLPFLGHALYQLSLSLSYSRSRSAVSTALTNNNLS